MSIVANLNVTYDQQTLKSKLSETEVDTLSGLSLLRRLTIASFVVNGGTMALCHACRSINFVLMPTVQVYMYYFTVEGAASNTRLTTPDHHG